MLALSTLIYNSVFGTLTALFGVGFFTSIVLFFKNCVSYFISKNEKNLEALSETENSLPDNIENESGKSVHKNKMRRSKSLINLSDISKQTDREKPQTTGKNFKTTQVDEI